jgi:UDP-N-acetylglucosamine acyltransferase
VVPGRKAHLEGLNLVGLKRRGFSSSDIQQLREVYGRLFESQEDTLQERLDTLPPDLLHNPVIEPFVAFLREKGKRPRPLCLPLSKTFSGATPS